MTSAETKKEDPKRVGSRIRKELEYLLRCGFKAQLLESHSLAENWYVQAVLLGPSGTPYEDHFFKVTFSFESDYPFRPPLVRFEIPVYHCNVSSRGHVCLDILKDQWSPALTIEKVLLGISSVLADPNPHDPVEPEIAQLYLQDRAKHDRRARDVTVQHAMRSPDLDTHGTIVLTLCAELVQEGELSVTGAMMSGKQLPAERLPMAASVLLLRERFGQRLNKSDQSIFLGMRCGRILNNADAVAVLVGSEVQACTPPRPMSKLSSRPPRAESRAGNPRIGIPSKGSRHPKKSRYPSSASHSRALLSPEEKEQRLAAEVWFRDNMLLEVPTEEIQSGVSGLEQSERVRDAARITLQRAGIL